MDKIYQIYDRIFKRIFNLSNLSIINLVNGLFGTNHPPDSTVQYFNREFVKADLGKRFADIFLSIDDIDYHLEAQMTKDNNIVFRAFEYGFYHALETFNGNDTLHFPEPIIIYLDTDVELPSQSQLTLDFGAQGTFDYKVANYIYQEHNIVELNQKKLVILIPFQLLKLRKLIEKEPSKEHFALLQNLIRNDILGSIKANLQVGNITEDDANQLKELTKQLYTHIYQHYEELGGHKDMKPLLDGAMELPMDKYRIRIDELETELAKKEEEVAKREEEAAKKEEEAAKKEEEAQKFEAEVRRLKERIKELEKNM